MIKKNTLGILFLLAGAVVSFPSLAMHGDTHMQETSVANRRTVHPLDFSLKDVVTEEMISLSTSPSSSSLKATVVIFMCNHCPYVIHILDKLIEVANTYVPQGIRFVGISSNEIAGYPEDAPEKMQELAITKNFPFPYLFDETQEVARAYDAACTPDIFVLNENFDVVYRGQFDDTRPGGKPSTGEDLQHLLGCILAEQSLPEVHKPSMGCSIKWKSKTEEL
jgi:thiol-disulfide isomerase/thioredoxin